MINRDLLKNIIISQKSAFLKITNPIDRDVLTGDEFSKICEIKEAIIITGVRRCGKSYLMKLIWEKIKKNDDSDNFLYINFEDEKLLNFKASDFDLLLDSYYELYPVNINKKIYLFFDEIQNIKGWEKFLNRLLEEGNYKIFVTGSNASLLSKEMATALTGRSYPITLYPFSFKEFIFYKIGHLSSADIYKKEVKNNIIIFFENYLQNGGFPEVVLQDFRPLLQEYLKDILYRDIISRYRIKYEASLRELINFNMANIGTAASFEKIGKMTKIKSLMTVKNYISYLENSFLFLLIPKFNYSIKKQIYNPKKVYAIDTGMYNEVAFANSANRGRILENLVFLELKRRKKNIYYYSEKNECDFLIQEKSKITQAIQVTEELYTNNKERELTGLTEAMDEYNLNQGLILTKEQKEETRIGRKKVVIMPIYEWLLG